MASCRLVSSHSFLGLIDNCDLSVAYALFPSSKRLVVKSARRRGQIACRVEVNFFKGHDRNNSLVAVVAEVL